MTPAIDRHTRRLLTQLAALEGVLNGSLATTCPARLQTEAFATARELRKEMARPISDVIQPYRPWSGIVRGGSVATTDSSVGTTEGREP